MSAAAAINASRSGIGSSAQLGGDTFPTGAAILMGGIVAIAVLVIVVELLLRWRERRMNKDAAHGVPGTPNDQQNGGA